MTEQDQIYNFIKAIESRMNNRERSICIDIYKRACKKKNKTVPQSLWDRLQRVAQDLDQRESNPELYKKLHTPKPKKSKTPNWAQASTQERNFYTNYQPKSFNLPRTPTQLVKGRLALNGISKYNGNHISHIPTAYLQSLIKSNRITNKQDQEYIMAHLELRQIGTHSGPSECNESNAGIEVTTNLATQNCSLCRPAGDKQSQ